MVSQQLAPWAATLASWTLTFLVHSTLLVGAVWLSCRLGSGWSFRAKNFLWRVALVGALASTGAQALVAPELPHWTFRIGARDATRMPVEPVRDTGIPGVRATPSVRGAPAERARAAVVPPPLARRFEGVGLDALLLGVWTLGLAALARLGLRLWALRRLLAPRTAVPDDHPLWDLLDDLRFASGVRRAIRLSHSGALASPAALGRSEIVVPSTLLARGGSATSRAALAHEIAHLEHADPVWLRLALALEAALVFQPLLRLARAQLQASGEYAADDWAVRATGSGVDLARALAEAAHGAADRVGALVPCMAARPGALVRRVERLLSGSAPRDGRIGGMHVALALAGVTALCACAPTVSYGSEDTQTRTPATAPLPATPPVAPQAPRAPAPPAVRAPAAPAPPVRPVPPAFPAPPAPPARPAPVLPPSPADQLGRELGAQALEVSRISRGVEKAHLELARLRTQRASESEIDAAASEVERLQDELEAAQTKLDEASEAFSQKMDAWSSTFAEEMQEWAHGEEMERWQRDMEKWGEEIGDQIQEQVERDLDRDQQRDERDDERGPHGRNR